MTTNQGDHGGTSPEGTVTVTEAGSGTYTQEITAGPHRLVADEPKPIGDDAGPNPYDLLLAALGACTSMTLNLYATRKKWALDQAVVRLRHERAYPDDCVNCEDPKSKIDRIWCSIELIGALDEAQRTRLIEIAKQCPIHRTLTNKIEIRTDLVTL